MPLYFYPIAKQWPAHLDPHVTRINSGEKRCRAGDCLGLLGQLQAKGKTLFAADLSSPAGDEHGSEANGLIPRRS